MCCNFADWATHSLTQTEGATLQQFSAAARSQLHNWSQQVMPQQQMQRLGLQPGSSSTGRGISSSAAQGSQCDCPTLGGPTPDIVTVEYDEDDVDR